MSINLKSFTFFLLWLISSRVFQYFFCHYPMYNIYCTHLHTQRWTRRKKQLRTFYYTTWVFSFLFYKTKCQLHDNIKYKHVMFSKKIVMWFTNFYISSRVHVFTYRDTSQYFLLFTLKKNDKTYNKNSKQYWVNNTK